MTDSCVFAYQLGSSGNTKPGGVNKPDSTVNQKSRRSIADEKEGPKGFPCPTATTAATTAYSTTSQSIEVSDNSSRSVKIDPQSMNSSLSSAPPTPPKPTTKVRQVDSNQGPASAALQQQQQQELDDLSPRGPLHEQIASFAKEDDEIDDEIQENKNLLLRHIGLALTSGRLTLINLSRRGLKPNDAHAIQQAIIHNPHLAVLKLSYNDLGDQGTAIIAAGFNHDGKHHESLSLIDLGFNNVGDVGCAQLALHAIAGNRTLKTVYLSGNRIKKQGIMALAGAILHGCGMSAIHLCFNTIGPVGIQALARAVAEREAMRCAAATDADDMLVPSDVVNKDIQTVEELHFGGTAMESRGFATIPSMLLTNFSMQVLDLSSNNLGDSDTALLAQSLTRNKRIPLRVLNMSHNNISCVGVEDLMNAVWGSKVLREMRFDNNKIRDRGAQLFAVSLTSMDLEVIDISCNKVTTAGIKAMMKSLSENKTLQHLGMCGIPIDPNSAKALSYGIAYNSSLRYLYIDNCSVGYAAQRHVVAGIVSNRNASLRVMTGFALGAIVVTLGLPKPLENWTNDQVLGFIRKMWKLWRTEKGGANDTGQNGEIAVEPGPASPADVVAASKRALAVIGVDGAAHLNTEPYEREVSQSSPLANTNASLLERTLSGTLRVPPIVQGLKGTGKSSSSRLAEAWSESGMDQVSSTLKRVVIGPRCDPARKERNLLWLRDHFRSLHEIGRLPFNNADLWQLHQYFYSPLSATVPRDEERRSMGTSSFAHSFAVETTTPDGSPTGSAGDPMESVCFEQQSQSSRHKRPRTPHSTPLHSSGGLKRAGLERAISCQMLDQAAEKVVVASLHSYNRHDRPEEALSDDDDEEDDDSYSSSSSEDIEPSSKRAKSFKPRIAFYPRIREKLVAYGTKASKEESLALLRQLKFAENAIFQGRDVYTNPDLVRGPGETTPSDIEMIILDLL